jgi:hypothetical protein
VIVKVQVSLFAPGSCVSVVLIYDKQRKFTWQGALTEELKELMNGRVKAFFVASLDDRMRFLLNEEAAWQTW